MQVFIETERLLMRELVPQDAAGMFALDGDAEVHRYLGNNPVKTIAESQRVIEIIREQYVTNGIGRWAVIEKATGNFVGWSGLKLDREPTNGHIDFYDLGYRFIKKYWGLGYATEAARACVAYGFDTLSIQELFGRAHVDNLASQHVLQKAGLIYVETIECYGAPHKWYKAVNPRTFTAR